MAEYETLLVMIDKRGGSRYRTYNVRQRICDSGLEIFDFPLDRVALRDSHLGCIGYDLIKKLNDIDGIEGVVIRPYSLCVERNIVYTWADIENDILFTIEAAVKKPVEIKRR